MRVANTVSVVEFDPLTDNVRELLSNDTMGPAAAGGETDTVSLTVPLKLRLSSVILALPELPCAMLRDEGLCAILKSGEVVSIVKMSPKVPEEVCFDNNFPPPRNGAVEVRITRMTTASGETILQDPILTTVPLDASKRKNFHGITLATYCSNINLLFSADYGHYHRFDRRKFE